MNLSRRFHAPRAGCASIGRPPPGGGIVVPQDGPAAVFVPTTEVEWEALGIPVPTVCYDCQDASGNLAPSIGAVELVPNGNGKTYQNSVTGWTRKFLGLADNQANARWGTTDSSLDLASGDSFYMLGYVAFNSTSTRRLLIAQSDTDSIIALSDGTFRSVHNSGIVLATQNHENASLAAVHPFLWARDAVGNTSRTYTDLEQINNTHAEGAKTGLIRGIGAATGDPPSARIGLFALWKNPATALGKATLEALGWALSY